MRWNLIVAFVAGFVVGGSYLQFALINGGTAAVVEKWMGGASKDIVKVAGDNQAAATATGDIRPAPVVSTGQNSVVALPQSAGETVLVSALTISASAWVAIHEDAEGEPGRVLGARRFDSGIYTGEAIELLRPTLSGGLYYAALYADEGDRQFDLKKDPSIQGASGKAVITSFEAL